MWIWVLSESDGGNLSAIIADSKRYGISTLIIKSSDGTSIWPQFNSQVVQRLHAAHMNVCAWQYVYGAHPIMEAKAGAAAVADGADCLMIDAESEYQGRYVQAQAYIKELRALIGPSFPVALAGLPYIDYHPGFPYSVFLGPGGAQYNEPQMYWRDIGTTVPALYKHNYDFNELYQRPISPLGQVYNSPPTIQVYRFRAISRYYGGGAVSWWDWQEAGPAQFAAVAKPVGAIPGFVADTTVASLGPGALGDVVVWAQEHLDNAGAAIVVDGDYGRQTKLAVEHFQAAHGLAVDGVIGPLTWAKLLAYRPVAVTWVATRHSLGAVVARGGQLVQPVPESARRPGRRDELAGAGGAGLPDAAQRTPR